MNVAKPFFPCPLDAADGRCVWTYSSGAIIATTVVVEEGQVYSLGCWNPKIVKADPRRIRDAGLWQNLWMVCLDAGTGKRVCEQQPEIKPGTVVVYLSAPGERLSLRREHILMELPRIQS